MIKETGYGVLLSLYVRPNAKKNAVEGIDEWRERIKVSVTAPPVGGKANRELVKFLSKLLGAEVEIVRGETSREKDVLVKGKTVEEVKKKLGL
ncbi:DUF167 domain-containing protein [Pyrococcus yayanosii]|uniref:UPF0235 protein PYCH_05170 n=1 Tax=Pyrococcus yayanosii (strain CH1 / JCM 16557) TaxID=529709 RepID=F8AHS4_PYRYC|nr:DUF167 domain-containing protein [Pyrococcus yayanosii]AEH24207.1 hypothetical protein PYCH_05170 [Pyrococcus yayanosii CH1]